MNIKWHKIGDYAYGFCLISENNEQTSEFSNCKDYIQDLYAHAFNREISTGVYAAKEFHLGFREPCISGIKIAYRIYNEIFDVATVLDYIHQVEEALGISPLSKIEESNKPKIYIAHGSDEWLLATPMISLYTFLLRTSSQHKMGDSFIKTIEQVAEDRGRDCHAAGGLLKIIKKMIKLGVKKIFSGPRLKNYPTEIDTHEVGIYGFSCEAESSCVHWYE